jgi:hypothetical protein
MQVMPSHVTLSLFGGAGQAAQEVPQLSTETSLAHAPPQSCVPVGANTPTLQTHHFGGTRDPACAAVRGVAPNVDTDARAI